MSYSSLYQQKKIAAATTPSSSTSLGGNGDNKNSRTPPRGQTAPHSRSWNTSTTKHAVDRSHNVSSAKEEEKEDGRAPAGGGTGREGGGRGVSQSTVESCSVGREVAPATSSSLLSLPRRKVAWSDTASPPLLAKAISRSAIRGARRNDERLLASPISASSPARSIGRGDRSIDGSVFSQRTAASGHSITSAGRRRGGSSTKVKRSFKPFSRIKVPTWTPLPLTSVLQKSLPQLLSMEGKRLNLVGKAITSIDRIPERLARGISTLFLSDNNLTSLKGIEQFHNLRTLSLANNLIRRLIDLEPLTALMVMESLLLEGNPVTSEPNYRLYVIGLLAAGNLASLDKLPVTPAERQAGPLAVRRFKTFIDQGIKNCLEIMQLEHLVQLLIVHEELRESIFGRRGWASAPEGSLSSLVRGSQGQTPSQALKRLLDVIIERCVHIGWDIGWEGGVGDQQTEAMSYLKHAMERKLRQDCADVFDDVRARIAKGQGGSGVGGSEVWEWAYGQVLLRQQEVINHLSQRGQALIQSARAKFRVFERQEDGGWKGGGGESEAATQGHYSPSTISASPRHRLTMDQGGGGGLHLQHQQRRLGQQQTTSSSSPSPTLRSPTTPTVNSWPLPVTVGVPVDQPDREEMHRKYTQLLKKRHALKLQGDGGCGGAGGGSKARPGRGDKRDQGDLSQLKESPVRREEDSTFSVVEGGGGRGPSTSISLGWTSPVAGRRGNMMILPPKAPPSSSFLPFNKAGAIGNGNILPSSSQRHPPQYPHKASSLPSPSPVRSLADSLPPQQEEPPEDELLLLGLDGPSAGGGAAAGGLIYHPQPLPDQDQAMWDTEADQKLYKALMSERLSASQRLTPAKTVKGLQQQIANLHADVLRRVKADFQLYRLNKALRKKIEVIKRLRLEEMDRADAHIATAEAELARLGQGVEALKAKGQAFERLRSESVRGEELIREYKQLMIETEDAWRRDEFLVVQAGEDQEALQRRLLAAREDFDEAVLKAQADDTWATGAEILALLERADEYRRQRIRSQYHQSVVHPLRHFFHHFRARLVYAAQERTMIHRFQARLLCMRAFYGLRRWRKKTLEGQGRRLVAARYRLTVRRLVWARWRRRWMDETGARLALAATLARKARRALHRMLALAKEGRERWKAERLLKARRLARTCLRAWYQYHRRIRYTSKAELLTATSKADVVWQHLIWRRWTSVTMRRRKNKQAWAQVIQAKDRLHTTKDCLVHWQREATFHNLRRRALTRRMFRRWYRVIEGRSAGACHLYALLEARRDEWLKASFGQWKAGNRWCRQRDRNISRLVKSFRRRLLRRGVDLWVSAVRELKGLDPLLDKAMWKRSRVTARKMLRAWSIEAKRQKTWAWAIQRLERLVRRKRLKIAKRRWAFNVRSMSEQEQTLSHLQARAEWMRRSRTRAVARLCLRKWREEMVRGKKLFATGQAVLRRRRRNLLRKSMKIWMWTKVHSSLLALRQDKRDRQQMELARLSMARTLQEEAEKCEEADERLRRLQEALARTQAALASKDVEAREVKAKEEWRATRAEGLKFKVDMLEEEIEYKRKQVQELKAGRRLVDGGGGGGDAASALVVKSPGEDGDENNVPRVIDELREQLKGMDGKIKELKEEERALQRALLEYTANDDGLVEGEGSRSRRTDEVMQAVIFEAQEHRASYEELYLQAHVLEEERQAMQDRLEACLFTLENAEKNVLRHKQHHGKEYMSLDGEVRKLRQELSDAEEKCAEAMQKLKLTGREVQALGSQIKRGELLAEGPDLVDETEAYQAGSAHARRAAATAAVQADDDGNDRGETLENIQLPELAVREKGVMEGRQQAWTERGIERELEAMTAKERLGKLDDLCKGARIELRDSIHRLKQDQRARRAQAQANGDGGKSAKQAQTGREEGKATSSTSTSATQIDGLCSTVTLIPRRRLKDAAAAADEEEDGEEDEPAYEISKLEGVQLEIAKIEQRIKKRLEQRTTTGSFRLSASFASSTLST